MKKHRIIKFIGNGKEDVIKGQHAQDHRVDFTLCGITLDGDKDTAGEYVEKLGRITCLDCLAIINYCKSL